MINEQCRTCRQFAKDMELEGKKGIKCLENQLAELIKNDIATESPLTGYSGT